MWGFDDCCSRCKTNDGVVYDYVTKKISCSDCGHSIATIEQPKDTSSHPTSVDTTTEPNNAAASSSDEDNLKNLGFDPLAVATTQQSNASSDDATIIASMSARLKLLATVKKQATEISEQTKGQIAKRNVRFAASIYIACRQNGMALSIREICSVANGAEVSKVSSAVRSVLHKLGLPPQLMHIRAAEFAKRYSTELQMDSQAVKAAEEAAERCTDHVNSGRPPSSVAAAVVYIIAQLSHEKKLLKDMKDATGLHENTIRETYKDLYPYLSMIIPTWFAKRK
ncbi:hypothetical protein Bca52824_008319 [Brassica carinata]|uniref:Transcription factor TFIIB cyclin-like domain-containing protein n=1 Tax=Brassica carinata TaxID=52824 RepID=A0A8X7W920_BRACI|nr:hypothetical protein Bca52824_008319 [Brassica carinata]